MRFHLSSNTDFLSGPESYVRFELKRTGMNTDFDNHVSLDEMGAHGLFRSIEVRMVSSGVLLQRYQYYNRYAILQSNLYQSCGDVEAGWNYGDAMSQYSGNSDNNHVGLVFTVPNDVSLDASKILTANVADMQKLEIGDTVSITYSVGGLATGLTSTVEVVILEFLSAGTAQCQIPEYGALPVIAAADNPNYVTASKNWYVSPRMLAVQDNDKAVIIEMKPMLSLLQHQLPLFLMKGGIEIIFELEQPVRALQSMESRTFSANKTYDYQIDNARFMGMFVTPHPDIVAEYLQQWKGSGLQYSIPSVVTQRKGGQSNDQDISLTMHPGVRSARRAYTVVQHEGMHDNESNDGRISASLSTYLRTYINEFQYKVGSHNFPNREVRTAVNSPNDDVFSEAFEQLKLVSGSNHFRFNQRAWSRINLIKHTDDTTASIDSEKFIMSADFARVQGTGADLSGVDLSIVPLDLDIKRDAEWGVLRTRNGVGYSALPASKPVYWTFIEHDAFLVISDRQVAVFQ
jgi:hypothetical protein